MDIVYFGFFGDIAFCGGIVKVNKLTQKAVPIAIVNF